MRGLKGKRVLITGGASGIGAATAARFLEEGARVCVLDRDAAACERIRHELAALGEAGITSAIIADVTEEHEVDQTGTAPGNAPESHEQAALNARETDVLRLLVQGLANKEIAAHMEVSESTVKNTIQQLFAKTGVRTRSQLVRVALEQYRNAL